MSSNVTRHHRRSIRLQGYDYTSPGAYFITIVTRDRACLFGEVVDGEMRLNQWGEVITTCWRDIPSHYPFVALDAISVMPNHVHGIIIIRGLVGAGFKPAPTRPRTHGLPEIIRGFKTFSARRINEMRATPGVPVWQRNYYERVIRDDDELNVTRQYIIENPARWNKDRENPNTR